jgi:hypothetical protein
LGKGHIVRIVDERANSAQREALLRIMSGQDSDPGVNVFQVFSTTYEKVYDPVFTRIDFTMDIDSRTARINVPGLIDGRGEPIVNAVTGKQSRARINLREGFEYTVAEVGRGFAKTSGPVQLNLQRIARISSVWPRSTCGRSLRSLEMHVVVTQRPADGGNKPRDDGNKPRDVQEISYRRSERPDATWK